MIVYGWRTNTKQLQVAPNQFIVLTYRYFHIMWILQLTYSFKYSFFWHNPDGTTGARDLTSQEAEPYKKAPELGVNLWTRYSLILLIVLFAFIIIMAAIGNRL